MADARMRIAEGEAARRAMPRRINFTEASVRRVACPPGKRVAWVYDTHVGSLAYSITDKGGGGFYFYRWHNGRPVRKLIGKLATMTVDQARKRVQALNAEYNEGTDAIAEAGKVKHTDTLGALWTAYKTKHLDAKATPKTRVSESSLYDTCLAAWAARPLSAITFDACRDLHTKLGSDRGGRTANRAIEMIMRLLRWVPLPLPFEPKKFAWFPEHARERYLEPAELARLTATLSTAVDTDLADFVSLALLTGARRDNIASMAWAEVVLDAGVWRIPASKSKNRKLITIPLPAAAVDLLTKRKAAQATRETPTPFVFPFADGTRYRAGQSFYEAFAAIRGDAGLADVHLHDLRRTLGSWMLASGASLPTIGKQLGHQSQSSTAIYARMNMAGVRAAVDATAAAMIAAANPKPAKKKGGRQTKKN